MTKQELVQFICEMYNINECNSLILRQINKYVTEHRYDYLDIARALSYFVDVQGQEPQPKYGIAIVPIVMKDSQKYFEKLRLQKESQIKAAQMEKNKNKNTESSKIYCLTNYKKTIKKHQIDISKIE